MLQAVPSVTNPSVVIIKETCHGQKKKKKKNALKHQKLRKRQETNSLWTFRHTEGEVSAFQHCI